MATKFDGRKYIIQRMAELHCEMALIQKEKSLLLERIRVTEGSRKVARLADKYEQLARQMDVVIARSEALMEMLENI